MKINPPELFLNVHSMCALYTSFPARKVIPWHSHYKLSKGETQEKQIHFFLCTNICKMRVWDFFFLDIFAHLSSIGTLDLTESAHVSESDSWEKHRSESNSHIAGKITSLNAKRFWLKGLRKRQMPVIGPDTNLFIAKPKQGEVWSSGFTSQDQALGLLGFHFSENHRDGRWERLVRSSCPHAPAGVGRDCLFASFSSASSRFKQLQQEDCYCKKIPLPTCPSAKPLF